MLDNFAFVKNVQMLADCGEQLMNRAPGTPGIGVIWGRTGYGKTTAATWFANETDAIYVRALATWTPFTMLSQIMRELDGAPLRTCAEMAMAIGDTLSALGKPLFIDEADYLLTRLRLVETVRDLHDLSRVPIIMIGMHEFRQRLVHREQLAGRVGQWVCFRPASLEDVRLLAKASCKVTVEEDLLDAVRVQSGGEIRVAVSALHKIELLARRLGIKSIGLEHWGDQPFDIRGAD